jgi:hypothetical protein
MLVVVAVEFFPVQEERQVLAAGVAVVQAAALLVLQAVPVLLLAAAIQVDHPRMVAQAAAGVLLEEVLSTSVALVAEKRLTSTVSRLRGYPATQRVCMEQYHDF